MRIRTLGSIFLFFISSLLSAGSVDAFVDNDEVFAGDSVVLTITVVGENIKSLPNISTIGGAKVINSSRRSGSSFSSVNGKAKMEVTESLVLEFVPEGNMTVPSFQVEVDGKLESSKPISIKITKERKKSLSSANFALDMKLNKTEAFVGEPIIAKVIYRQKRSLNVLDIEYIQPKFKGFFSQVVGKQRNYNKGNYTFMELRYLLSAKKEGDIRVEPAKIKVAQSTGNDRFGGWFAPTPKWSRLISNSPTISIKKPIGDFDIVGSYSLDDSVDKIEVKANKPINLKIELKGEGSLEDYEGIEFDIADVTVYGDDAKVDRKLRGEELISHYSKQFVFISNHDFTIPSKSIRAYNYKTKKIETLKTKEYKIKVIGKANNSTAPAVYTKTRVDSKPNSNREIKRTISWEVPSWFMLIGAFILGIIATVVAGKYLPPLSFGRFRAKLSIDTDSALATLYPKIGESAKVEEMVRKLYDKKQGKKVNIDRGKLKNMIEEYKTEELK